MTISQIKIPLLRVFQSQTFNGEIGTGPAIPRPLEKALRDGYADNFKHVVMASWNNSQYLNYKEINISKTGSFYASWCPRNVRP